jgi:GNAT superfamily N-acetyltransferase
MNTTHRWYSEESGDFLRLSNFIMDHHSTFRDRSTWSIGRIVDWKYGLYPNKRAFAAFTNENAQLWFDGFGALVGFVICESGDTGFAILTLDGARFLYEEMLDWAIAEWSSRGPCLRSEITEHQQLEAAALERRGFKRTQTFFTRIFDLTGPLVERSPLEAGFTIVDMHAHPDYLAQRVLRDDGFCDLSQRDEAEMAEWMRMTAYSHTSPIYHAPTDICVMAPDGRLVAGCEALIDTRSAEADIERVCTHSAFRKRGFARAAIQECLYRLKDMGIKSAYITGYSPAAIALYGSIGATGEQADYVYERLTA